MAEMDDRYEGIGPRGGGGGSVLVTLATAYLPGFEDYNVLINGEWRRRSDPIVSSGLSDLCYGANTTTLQDEFQGSTSRDGRQLGIFPGFDRHYFHRDPKTGKFYVPYTSRIINPFDVFSGKINWFDNNQKMIGSLINAASISLTLAEYNFVFEGMWHGRNAGWYSTAWQGNQWTGGRSIALQKAGILRIASRGFFMVGTGISTYQGILALQSKEYYEAAGAGFDIAMSALATFGGPPGLIVGGGYLALDALGTFDPPLYSIPNIAPLYAIPDNTFVVPKIIIP